MGARMDFLLGNEAKGEVAGKILANKKMDPGAMRPWINPKTGKTHVSIYMGGPKNKRSSYRHPVIQANGTLRRDEWKQLDEAVLGISRNRLNGIASLQDRGLTYGLGNGMGTTVLEHHTANDPMAAILSMDGVTRGPGDRTVYGVEYLPIPIIHVDYEINHRVLENSRRLGNPLDVGQAESATRRVVELLEQMLFTDTTFTFGGGTIFSYVNHTYRNQVVMTELWDAAGKTGAEIVAEVLVMKQAAIDAMHYGPYELYIPTAYETVLDADYDATTPGTTIRERILKISSIESIKVVDNLPEDNVLLVQMTSDVVRLVNGMDIRNIEWMTEGGMVTKYKVMAIQVPQVRSDKDNNSGVVHLAPED